MVAQRTYAALEPQVQGRSLGELTLKGLNKPIAVYEILNWADARATDGGSGLRSDGP